MLRVELLQDLQAMVDVATPAELTELALPRWMQSFCGLAAATRTGDDAVKANPEADVDNKLLLL